MAEENIPVERRVERVPVDAEIDLRRTRHLKYRVTIRDFSPEGASLNLVDRVELGEIIWIKFDGLESLESQVRWTRDFVAGVKFAKPLHPAVFARLIEHQPAVPAPVKSSSDEVPFDDAE